MFKLIKKALLLLIIVVFSFGFQPSFALASVQFKGQFTANKSCDASVSTKKDSQSDNFKLTQGETYQVIGKNKEIASYYRLQIPTANPPERWVAADCGNVVSIAPNPSNNETPIVTIPGEEDFLLALSWQPAFCEGLPDKPECQRLAQNPDRFEATHFILHGLWPQPRTNIFCNVSKQDISFDEGKNKDWSKLPAIEKELSPKTWEKLQVMMPGTVSYLQRHEWIKHGTCYPGTAEEYFSEAIALAEAFNNSSIQKLVQSNIGNQVAVKDIDQALSSFGSSTGDKVEVKCTNAVLGELWVNLKGDITSTTPVSKLLKDATIAKKENVTSCLIDDAKD